MLTADASNIGDPDGIAGATFSYQWIADDGTTDSDIDGATGETYWPSAGDVGNTIKVKVSFTDDEDNAESVTSAATESRGRAGGNGGPRRLEPHTRRPRQQATGSGCCSSPRHTRTAEATDIGDLQHLDSGPG